ncbi:MAG: hypothetical protein ACJAU6_001194 [Alphaproteobacteria bacterium]|jgi:hypothetical protein
MVRLVRIFSVALFASLVTAACGELPRPFKPEVKGLTLSPLAQLGDGAGVVVAPIANAPLDVGAMMADSIASRLRQANVPATTTDALTNGYLLEGRSRTAGAGQGLVIDWILTNPYNVVVDRRTTMVRPTAAAALNPEVGLNPGVGNEWPIWRRIDNAAIGRATSKIADAVAELLQSNTPVKKDLPPALLAVASVTGASGDGNESLKRAFEAVLHRAGLAVAATPREATVLIDGVVVLQDVEGAQKALDITWSFRDSSGRNLGVMTQRNRVRNNQVESRWGSLAYDITLAAIDGVVSVLRRRDEIDALTRP